MDDIKTFLKENNELLQSPFGEDNIHPKIVGYYILNKNDVGNQVIDWILNYLDNRNCPYSLAVAIAKNTAQLIEKDISLQAENPDFEMKKALNSVHLYTETIKKVSLVCNSLMEQENDVPKSIEPFLASVFGFKNKRRKMEDRHVIHHDLNLLLDLKDMQTQSYYAVFDGHAGVDAASYASAHLHVNMVKHPSFSTDPATAIKEAYIITDQQFVDICNKENVKSGTTAVCALIREKTVYLSWLGDSQAVLVTGGKPVIVTNPHKPERADEQKRIEDLGGHIINTGISRVNGVLAVTRALGDADHKPYISNEPDLTTVHLEGHEDFLILACDGLWDGMSPDDVAAALYHNLSESALDEPLDAVAAKLVHQSKLQGSEDNITAVVVFLRDIKEIKEYATELMQQSSNQLNFLGMNGEGNADKTPIKPTVLDLNSKSEKKKKNAVNVLSSTGILPSSYSGPNPGNSVDGSSYQPTSTDNSVFVQHSNAASCLPPEATALSELPTPPIDDIVASQQFEKLSPEVLCQELLSSDICRKNTTDEALEPDLLKHGSETTDAMDLASNVVSNTIETAVKCLSSNEVGEPTAVSPLGLNPYAEPFVMRSFVSNDVQTDESKANESVTKMNSLANPFGDTPISDNTKSNPSNLLDFTDEFSGCTQPPYVKSSPVAGFKETSSDITLLEERSREILLASQFSSLELKDPGSSYRGEPFEENVEGNQNNSLTKEDMLSKNKDITDEEMMHFLDFKPINIECNQINSLDLLKDNIPIECEKPQEKTMQEHLNTECNLSTKIESKTPIFASVSEDYFLSNASAENIIEAKPSESSLSIGISEGSEQGHQILSLEEVVPVLEGMNNELAQLSSTLNINQFSELKGENISETKELEGVAKDSLTFLNIQDTETSAAILSSDQGEECHVETFAVDLQTVPVGVPEAEGVTEDVDSDSEKDGGWSYMKGNNVGSSKTKTPVSKDSKVACKADVSTKLNKDISKPALDSKSKLKTATTVDKSRKLTADKKSVDVKERKPSTRPISSTMPKSAVERTTKPTTSASRENANDKTAKPTSTISRVKKELPASKVTAPPVSKNARPPAATTRPTIPNKTASPVAPKPTASSTALGNARPKSTVSAVSSRINVKPTATSTLARGQPSNQSTKSNVASTVKSATLNRPAATNTVPSRLASKPALSSKPVATESKSKPVTSTMKRTVGSTLKKPDVKEAKDIVNKQISAKTTLTTSAKGTTTKVASTLTKSSVTSTLKSRPLSKSDTVKKDVPKPSASKFNARTSASTKVSQDLTKGKEKNVTNKEEKIEKLSPEVTEQKTSEITPGCEEEKFIREVNDKEVSVKVQEEKNVLSTQSPLEISASDVPKEEKVLIADSGLETLL